MSKMKKLEFTLTELKKIAQQMQNPKLKKTDIVNLKSNFDKLLQEARDITYGIREPFIGREKMVAIHGLSGEVYEEYERALQELASRANKGEDIMPDGLTYTKRFMGETKDAIQGRTGYVTAFGKSAQAKFFEGAKVSVVVLATLGLLGHAIHCETNHGDYLDLRDSNGKLTAQHGLLLTENNNLKSENANLKSENAMLRGQVADLIVKITNLEDQISASTDAQEIARLQAELDKANAELKEKTEALTKAQADIKELKKDLAESNALVESLRKQLQNGYTDPELADKLAKAEAENAVLRSQIASLQTDLENANDLYSELQSEHKALQQQYNSVIAENKDLKNQVSTLNSQIATLESKVTGLNSEIETLKATIKQLEEALKNAGLSEKERAEYEAAIASLQARLDAKTAELETAVSAYAQLEGQYKTILESYTALEKSINSEYKDIFPTGKASSLEEKLQAILQYNNQSGDYTWMIDVLINANPDVYTIEGVVYTTQDSNGNTVSAVVPWNEVVVNEQFKKLWETIYGPITQPGDVPPENIYEDETGSGGTEDGSEKEEEQPEEPVSPDFGNIHE